MKRFLLEQLSELEIFSSQQVFNKSPQNKKTSKYS